MIIDFKKTGGVSPTGEVSASNVKFTDGQSAQTKVTQLEQEAIKYAKPITYSALKALRDGGNLVAGQSYRITDYHTTTIQNRIIIPDSGEETYDADTMSADHQFDIIVTALTKDTLSDDARCCLHEGDRYFSQYGAELDKWRIKYSLDNDWRYEWSKVDTFVEEETEDVYERMRQGDLVAQGQKYYVYVVNRRSVIFLAEEVTEAGTYAKYGFEPDEDGHYIAVQTGTIDVESVTLSDATGVIYWMKDEWNNECPYDFKNIMFWRKSDETSEVSYDRFAKSTDEGAIPVYTFFLFDLSPMDRGAMDASLDRMNNAGQVRENIMQPCIMSNDEPYHFSISRNILPNNVIHCGSSGVDIKFGFGSYGNTVKGWGISLNNYCIGNYIAAYYVRLGYGCNSNFIKNVNQLVLEGENHELTLSAQSVQTSKSDIIVRRRVVEADLSSMEDFDSHVIVTTDAQNNIVIYKDSNLEDKSNKVTSISSQSTDEQYPSAKTVYDAVNNAIDSDTETTAVSEALVVGKTYKYMPSAGVATLAFTLTPPTETDVVRFWRFKFKSGATATEFTPPANLYWSGGKQLLPEANTIYEVMIDEDYCVSVLSFKQASV